MSGYAAVFHLDGAPVAPVWLEKMADFLAFRGPEGREVWISGSAGMCHALLRTSVRSDGAKQILSLRDRFWIVGDIRIDDRETLIARLSPQVNDLRNASSAELVLLAYDRWGEACVEHLLGDFSFVIWDAQQRRVFAARDHLGVRPLFYAQIGACLLISNTLDCIRQIQAVPDTLNDHAIGDWLLIGRNLHPSETFFETIHRLRVAHCLTAGREGVRARRYWTLPIDEPVYYRQSGDYTTRFNELLRAAVRDRLPDGQLGVFMSGGLDSPTLAATAVALGASVSAFTNVSDRFIPDQERYYSDLVASHLKIPIFYNAMDDQVWELEPDAKPLHSPEPVDNPLGLQAHRRYLAEITSRARVFFVGDGPDAALLYEWHSHFAFLISHGRWARLCGDLALHAREFRRVPLLSSIPRILRARKERLGQAPDHYVPSFPKWINPQFANRVGLEERWKELWTDGISPHPVRKRAYISFADDFPMDRNRDNGGCPQEFEPPSLHPFWDVRLLRFLLSVPVIPWCRGKHLIRSAAKGVIPEAVRRRPKCPLPGFPYLERIRRNQKPSLPDPPELPNYVVLHTTPEWPMVKREDIECAFRVLSLSYWLWGR